ncbi:MAG: penicillin-binding protein 1A [Pseudomonadales bacterium]
MAHITHLARITLWLLFSASTGTLLILASAYLYLSPKLPSVDALRDVQLQTPLRIYTADNQLIGEFGEKRRTPISFEQIPPLFISAILAAEDDRFYDHHGVDIKGLLRAASQLLATGSIQTGGSTITMQVAKNYFLSHERTFSRKFNEILLALQIERELPKNEILELYLNKIFLGHRAYGIEAAALVYYGKSINELDLAQLAMIAGLPKAPSAFNPLINPYRAKVRRNWIIGRMKELGYIDQIHYHQAITHPITAQYHGAQLALNAPYIAEMARKEMLSRYGKTAYTDGYRVYTTVDSQLQATAQRAVIDGLMAYDQRHGYRGPEQNILAEYDAGNHDLWLSVLAQTSRPGGLVPAIVSHLHEQAFTTLLADGSEVTLEWQQGLKDKRPYETVDRRGPVPRQVSDLVAIGDLIRLQQKADGSWQLSQLPAAQAALISLDANNGAIRSLVGGFDYNQSKFNRITQAIRQPGSNFKPFIYTAALAHGYTPASIINDAPIVFEDASLESTWRPTNDSGKFYGPTRLRYALFKSRNLVSIRLLQSLGIPKAINYTGKFGFDTSQLPRDLSLALGSHSLTPLQIVSGYSTLANGGYRVEPYLIDHIDNIHGEPIYQATPATVCHRCETVAAQQPTEQAIEPEELATIEDILEQAESKPEPSMPLAKRVIEPRVAYIIDSIMRDVVKKGTGRRARSLGRNDLAGKTGTTNGPTDAWFSGYGGSVVTTTWLGFDRNSVLGRREYGGSAALPIWIDYMKVALKDKPETVLKQPEGIVSVKIDPTTGLLAKPGQKNAIFEIFREELAPTEEADIDAIGGDTPLSEEVVEEDIF